MGLNKSLLFDQPTGLDQYRQAYALALLSNLTYFPDSNYDDRWRDFWGFTDSQVIVTPGSELPNYCRMRSSDGCVFAIAGTTALIQMAQNAVYSGQRSNSAFGPGAAHSFFLWVAEGLIPFLQADLAAYPAGTKLCFTGHSLGAAAAYLLAVWFSRNTDYDVRNYIGFCSPRPANPTFIDTIRSFNVRNYFNEGDWVSDLPPTNSFTFDSRAGGSWIPFRAEYKHAEPFLVIRDNGSLGGLQ